jgi:hypothetical protein
LNSPQTSPRIFLWWWLLIGMAGLFVALGVASAGDGNWMGVALSLGFAALCTWLGFVHRRKMVALEAMLERSAPAIGRGDLDYDGPNRAMTHVLVAFAIAFGIAQAVWLVIILLGH